MTARRDDRRFRTGAEEARPAPTRPRARHGDGRRAPRIMGIGPVPATEKLLARLRLRSPTSTPIELNEAFAAQSLAVLRGLRIADDAPM
jgi:3-oxoadipyl-CoA thiolase